MIINIDSDPAKILDFSTQKSKGCFGLIWCKDGMPRRVTRLKGKDENGILYIGKADVILDRVGSFQKTIFEVFYNRRSISINKGHQTFSKKFYRIKDTFDINDLKIKIWVSPFDDPEYVKSFLLEQYVTKFLELPPLNGQYGKFDLDKINHKEHISIDLL
ncbi:hypothetical protein KIM67_03455 [Flagellimonas sp. 389]|uniref:hypothetical protein n=1 Tax=Flagellimonas sp. 389 TaxID=2835862 RepID=UPI001BD67885|nr:hypothetical protein [Flagellimonas sp. 389]MBS9461452.1 hypothetical protein [Flagellimonas sp. 389]